MQLLAVLAELVRLCMVPVTLCIRVWPQCNHALKTRGTCTVLQARTGVCCCEYMQQHAKTCLVTLASASQLTSPCPSNQHQCKACISILINLGSGSAVCHTKIDIPIPAKMNSPTPPSQRDDLPKPKSLKGLMSLVKKLVCSGPSLWLCGFAAAKVNVARLLRVIIERELKLHLLNR